MANRLLTPEEFKESLKPMLQRFNSACEAYEAKRIARVLALKPGPDGRIKYGDIRKANRGG